MPFTAWIGIGSNQPFGALSSREVVEAAFGALETVGVVAARSRIYRTEPVGVVDQPAFLNAAAEIETLLAPEDLLEGLLRIERRFGRDRMQQASKGPRSLDLDLLFAQDALGEAVVLNTDTLTLPHPEAARRRFVLAPLAEIAPLLRHPLRDRSVGEILDSLPDEGPNAVTAVQRLEGSILR